MLGLFIGPLFSDTYTFSHRPCFRGWPACIVTAQVWLFRGEKFLKLRHNRSLGFNLAFRNLNFLTLGEMRRVHVDSLLA